VSVYNSNLLRCPGDACWPNQDGGWYPSFLFYSSYAQSYISTTQDIAPQTMFGRVDGHPSPGTTFLFGESDRRLWFMPTGAANVGGNLFGNQTFYDTRFPHTRHGKKANHVMMDLTVKTLTLPLFQQAETCSADAMGPGTGCSLGVAGSTAHWCYYNEYGFTWVDPMYLLRDSIPFWN
jgi:hypothetical protein